MTTVDIFGKTTKNHTSTGKSGLTRSQALTLFLLKQGYDVTQVVGNTLTSTDIVGNMIKLSTNYFKSWDLHIPQLTSNTTVYKVTDSSRFNADYAGWHAFNLQSNLEWASNNVTENYWIQIQLPVAVAIHTFIVMGRTNTGIANGEGPDRWVFQGSNNGTTWTTLYSAAITPNPLTKNKIVVMSLPNNPPTALYYYYRLFAFSSFAGSVNPGIAFMNFYAYHALS